MNENKYIKVLETRKEPVKLVIGPRSCGKTYGILDHIYKTQKAENYTISIYRFLYSIKYDLWKYYQDIYKREDLAIVKNRYQNDVMKNGKIFSTSTTLSSILSYDNISRHVENIIAYDDVFTYCRNDEEVKTIIDKLTTHFPFARIWISENPYVKNICKKYRAILGKSEIIPFDSDSYKRFNNAIYGIGIDEEKGKLLP